MLLLLLQSNQLYYTESGEKCQSKCDWSQLSNGSSYFRNCFSTNGSRSHCTLFKSILTFLFKTIKEKVYYFLIFLGECSETEFQCKTGGCKYVNDSDCHGLCIPKSWVQDGMEDCTDGSDEVVGKYKNVIFEEIIEQELSTTILFPCNLLYHFIKANYAIATAVAKI